MPKTNPQDNLLWQPSADQKCKSALWRFAEYTANYHGAAADDYSALHSWSVRSPEQFYSSLWDFMDILGDKGESAFLGNEDLQKAQFYPGAKLNYAENLLQNADDRTAIVAYRDDGSHRTITRKQLYGQVSKLVQALRADGVGVGDRVAAIVTNDIEAIVGYLACSAIGAIWSSCSPDFGPAAASDRLCQIDPKVLLAVPHYSYGGKHIEITSTIKAVAEGSNLERIILIGDKVAPALSDLPCKSLDDYLDPWEEKLIRFERLPFDAPLAILFSSGTTGKPKCIVHSAMGLLIQHKKELMLHCDLREGERFFYFTTCGWMMWNWLVSGLALEATLITYDGNPFYPQKDCLLELIDRQKISVFGTSAKYIDSCSNFGLRPAQSQNLESLRLVLSTGSPLIASSFDYVYRDWKAELQLASISGGTDICACFMGGNPLLPVYRSELQCSLLGIDIDTLDAEANPVEGVPGDLVCRNAHLSMPLGFWNDEQGAKYRQAYFSRFSGLWAQGDYVEKRPSGGFIIHGRSDTTLNPGGVRIGTAEIYRQLDSIAEVEEGIAVGQDWQGDQRVILFVKLNPGFQLDDPLITKIKQKIRAGATPRHIPAKILAIEDIPRTLSGKSSEAAVRDTIHGRQIKNAEALANPGCLKLFENIEALKN